MEKILWFVKDCCEHELYNMNRIGSTMAATLIFSTAKVISSFAPGDIRMEYPKFQMQKLCLLELEYYADDQKILERRI